MTEGNNSFSFPPILVSQASFHPFKPRQTESNFSSASSFHYNYNLRNSLNLQNYFNGYSAQSSHTAKTFSTNCHTCLLFFKTMQYTVSKKLIIFFCMSHHRVPPYFLPCKNLPNIISKSVPGDFVEVQQNSGLVSIMFPILLFLFHILK